MSPDMRMSMFDLTGYPHDRENVTQVQGKAHYSFYKHKSSEKKISNHFYIVSEKTLKNSWIWKQDSILVGCVPPAWWLYMLQ